MEKSRLRIRAQRSHQVDGWEKGEGARVFARSCSLMKLQTPLKGFRKKRPTQTARGRTSKRYMRGIFFFFALACVIV